MPERAVNTEIEIAKIPVQKCGKGGEESRQESSDHRLAGEIIGDDSISLIIEVMGGLEPAGTYRLWKR